MKKTIKVYCKKLELGTFFNVTMDWEVKSYNCVKNCFVLVEKKFTHGFRLVRNGFFSVYYNKNCEPPTSLQHTCDLIHECGIFSKNGADKFFLLFYYDVGNFCLLTSNENYLEDANGCEIIEVLEGVK